MLSSFGENPSVFVLSPPSRCIIVAAAYDKGTILFIPRALPRVRTRARARPTYIRGGTPNRSGLRVLSAAVSVRARCIGRVFSVQMDVNCGNEKALLRESTTRVEGSFAPGRTGNLHLVCAPCARASSRSGVSV